MIFEQCSYHTLTRVLLPLKADIRYLRWSHVQYNHLRGADIKRNQCRFSVKDAKEVYDRFEVVNRLEDFKPCWNLLGRGK